MRNPNIWGKFQNIQPIPDVIDSVFVNFCIPDENNTFLCW